MISIENIDKYKHYYYPYKTLDGKFIIKSLIPDDEYYEFSMKKITIDHWGDTICDKAGSIRLYRNSNYSMSGVLHYLVEILNDVSKVMIQSHIPIDIISDKRKFNYFIESKIKESLNIR